MVVRVVWFPIWHTLTTKTCLGHRPNQLCLKRPRDREATCFCSLMCEKVEFLNHVASESSRYVGPIWSQVWNECTLHDACTTIAAVILPNTDVRKGTKTGCGFAMVWAQNLLGLCLFGCAPDAAFLGFAWWLKFRFAWWLKFRSGWGTLCF